MDRGRRSGVLPAALATLALVTGCGRAGDETSTTGASMTSVELPDAALPSAALSSASADPEPLPEPPKARVVMMAAGDVCLARDLGTTLLREPAHDFFSPVAPLLKSADLRFANLEGPLSEQKGETQSPWNALTFTGPPNGAEALARAGFDVLSTANNHAWDYGQRGLQETLENLDRVGIAHVGTGRDGAAANEPVIVERNGMTLGFLAVTDIWNLGSLRTHKAASFVARADKEQLAASVRALRGSGKAEVIVVSYHGGVEYTDLPLPKTREILRAAIDAGADLVLGHHPHVLQGIEWHRGKPILYSLGNLLMRLSQSEKKPTGYLGKITVERGRPAEVEACPLNIRGIVPARVGAELPARLRVALEERFIKKLTTISRGLGAGIAVDAAGADGCMKVREAPREEPKK